ncbi:MAG: ABC transporter ATP-binding protein/permease [Coriobacteriaceae bacterium]|uniref:ABC transporter ATP-binding protein n=1 Tax=Tractidigestivibacter sp. TaxID=2847320 RepID=UPI002A81FB9A|nr:ABC transporter ATP-binding protein [Tractidigestivibacter sp.]MCI6547909.1 ABC transporter ATP-binding protein/permease [Coriobacteriaceae bacterium]MCI6844555.1 ABC transporter ATP-binding protein/permease [Coriobacteriaceae bacterium]MCI7437936.1 ABC transporter ATP-binding protein/permease [Coriobacteriaceae bacterium]MDY4534395.1 ABC transporter ATP-binding protein [Tractidigestivibacter sp.]MDY5271066.1 ABC transporter ATP-binding protein [Tractidigestivibacter sp.]
MAIEHDYSKRASWTVLSRLMRPHRRLAAAALALLLADIVGMLLIPTQLAALVNVAVGTRDTVELTSHGIAMLVAAVMGSGGCVASYYVASRLAAYVGRDLRIAVYRKSLALSGADFNSFGTGSMITRTLSDANVVQQTLLMTFMMVFPVPVTCVVSIVLAYGIDPVMGRLLLVLTLAMLAISGLAVARSTPIFLAIQGFVDRMNSRLREVVTGTRVIRAFGKEERERGRLNKTFVDYAANAIRVNMLFSIVDCATFFLMNVVEALVMWMGADRVGAGAMQIGSISALLEYAMLILFFMMMAQFAIIQVPRALSCLTRAAAVLDAVPGVADPDVPQRLAAPARPKPGDVVARFSHASFRFADADEDTLHDLDFSMRRGEVTAIMGNTGSGKSTVAKMLLRFHDVTAGSLRMLGTDVRDVTQRDLRSHVAYVPQQAWLFSGTIAENLRDGDASATDDALWHALDVAQASFVRELPKGLATRVAQGGSNFSGGQRQRLAIARALVRHADLYVFDDSFSALDYKTDAALRRALGRELGNEAVVIIAQRVSTVRQAAQIVVLGDGRVVGRGTHDQLMETCPAYRDIVESQTRGGVGADE